MIRFKDIVDSKCGIRYCFEQLELCSGVARRMLLETCMMESGEEIRSSYLSMLEAVRILDDADVYECIIANLCQLHDIGPTIARLGNGEVLDDIELFEIKHLALISSKVRTKLGTLSLCSDKSECKLPVPDDLEALIDILDPDGLRINSFYIYDSYSPELAALRNRIRHSDGRDKEEAYVEASGLEASIRAAISSRAKGFAERLSGALSSLALLDIVVAKAKMMEDKGYVIPKIVSEREAGSYEGLYHPEIASRLEKEGKNFQPIDFSFSQGSTLLVGINMGGKSVLLKMLALAQYLTQFGFAVPATSARVSVMEDIFLVSGDAESSTEGLSSFAGEIKSIEKVIEASRSGKKTLALIDEPARTTNPVEGTALVSALTVILEEMGTTTVITTHYDTPDVKCRCMRVKGYMDGKMDYSIIDAGEAGVPHEAIDTARRLGADRRWMELAYKFVEKR